MMSHDDLRQAICAAPDDHGVRTAFADWLIDHRDDKQAEFIRAQVDLEHWPAGSPQRGQRAARAAELLTQHDHVWAWDLPTNVRDFGFRRGLVERLTLPWSVLKQDGTAVFARCPLRELSLPAAGAPLPDLGRILPPNHVTDLDVSGHTVTATDLDKLGRVTCLPELRRLRLRSPAWTSPGRGPCVAGPCSSS